jgi:hypothetical protein
MTGGYENELRCHFHTLWQLVFFLPIAVGEIYSALGKYRNSRRMDYAPKTTPQIEETVHKDDASRMLVESNWPFFGIRHSLIATTRSTLRENRTTPDCSSVAHLAAWWLYDTQCPSGTQSSLACEQFGVRSFYPGPGSPT